MSDLKGDYKTGELSILLLASAVVGTVLGLIQAIGLARQDIWKAVAFSTGYMALLIVIRGINRWHGRPGHSIKAMLAASVTGGVAVLVIPLIWRVIWS